MTKEDIVMTIQFQNRENEFSYLGKKKIRPRINALLTDYQLQIHDNFCICFLFQEQSLINLCIYINKNGRKFRTDKIRVF